jgi:hypothetical protein
MWCERRMEKISWTDQMRRKSITRRRGGEKYPTNNKEKEG